MDSSTDVLVIAPADVRAVASAANSAGEAVRLLDTENIDEVRTWKSALHDEAARIQLTACIDEALAQLAARPFDLIVLACPRRGSFSANDAARLRTAAPLAHVAALVGPWCAGPWRRECDLLGGAEIIPWHRWPAWLTTNAGRLRQRLPPAWSLPPTAGDDEQADFWSRARLLRRSGLIAIDTASRDAAEAIGDALALAGWANAWHAPDADSYVQGATALVVEANGWDGHLDGRIADLHDRHPGAPVLLLLSFPLPVDEQRARAAGVAAVVAKPFTLHEFLGQLDAMLARRPAALGDAAA